MISCSNQDLNLLLQRLDALVRSSDGEKNIDKIWLNYKILEAELDRLNTE